MARDKIVYRDDDIYLTSSERSGQIYNFEMFKQAHELLSANNKIHTLAIIASEIDNYPEMTEYILSRKDEFDFGVHGWGHSDYSKWDIKDFKQDLIKARNKIEKTFGIKCHWFFAPWNRFTDEMVEATKEIDLETNIHYSLPEHPRQEDAVLCFHYWIPEQLEQLKKWL